MDFGSIHIYRVAKIWTCATKIQHFSGFKTRKMGDNTSRKLGWLNSREKSFGFEELGEEI
jgi:hypothetical protein